MSRILVLSLIAASISTVVGCGAQQHVASARDEACWQAPEEVAMHINDGRGGEASTPATSERLKGSFRPNRQERPVAGAVHAATY